MVTVNVHYAEDYHEILRLFHRIEAYDIIIYHYSVPQVKRFIQTYKPPDRLETVEPISMIEPLLLDNVRSITIWRHKYRTRFYRYESDDGRYVKIIKGYPRDLIRLGLGSTRERSRLHLQGYHPDGSVEGLVNDPVAYVARAIRSETFDLDYDYKFTRIERVIDSALSYAAVHWVELTRVDDQTLQCAFMNYDDEDGEDHVILTLEASLDRYDKVFCVMIPHEEDIYLPYSRLQRFLRDKFTR